MIKKIVKFTDFNDEEVEEEIYFHLSKPEIIELEVSLPEGFEAWVERVTKEEDKAELLRIFTMFVHKGYGQRSLDGKRFVKTPELLQEFLSSNAYEALFMDLLTDTDALIEFFNGIMPKGLTEDIAKVTALRPVETKEPVFITKNELIEMDAEALQEVMEKIKRGEAKVAE